MDPVVPKRVCRGKPRARLVRLARLALFAGVLVGASAEGVAYAGPRFGDSTWVAPGEPFYSEPALDGPRVAPPDREPTWETVLRTPFRVVFFPLRVVAKGLETGAGFVGPRLFEPKSPQPPQPGPVLRPYITFGALNDIGAGPEVTWIGFPTAGARFHLTGSWSLIDRRRAQFSETFGYRKPLALRLSADYDRKPNRSYYGIGNTTPETDRSYFLLEASSAEAALHIGASPLRQLRIAGGYSILSPRRGDHGAPLLEEVFDPKSAPYENDATREFWYGISGDLALLDDGRDPSRGVHGRLDLRRAAGLSSDDPDYYRWQAEGRAYVPVFAKRRVIAVRAVYAGVEPTGGAATVLPFYRLSQSGGDSRFAGYSPDRFRDRQLLLARIEYRWEILYRLSALALYEAGEVAPGAGAFGLRGAHTSYGGGLRLGLSEERTLRVELAKSVEGLQVVLKLGGDF